MKSIISVLLALGLASAASTAFACPWSKSASADNGTTVASNAPVEEEAMSTFDPETLQADKSLEEVEVKD